MGQRGFGVGKTVSSSAAGPLIGLLIALISGFTSTYTEIILKKKIPFWVTQTWLYAFGSLASGMILCFCDGPDETAFSPSILASGILHISVVVAVAANGLVVANILRKKDNLVKIVGTSASIVTIIIAQCLVFSNLRASTITMQTIAGIGITSISTWTYNYYKQTTTNSSELDVKEQEALGMNSRFFVPSQRRILWLCAVVVMLTWTTGHVSPKKQRDPLSATNDIARFFAPRNITPTQWGPGVNPPRCAWHYIVRKKVTTYSSEILNLAEEYLESGCPVFPIPDSGLIFHLYWRGPWHPQNDFSIEAFLATQHLGDGHRIIFWYNDGGPPSSTLE
jgi:Nucleotide-sugar transporter